VRANAKNATRSLALAVVSLAALAPGVQATEAKPAWKLLAISAPTNLPPKQSEVQRLTVEAEGGSFELTRKAGNGTGTPVSQTGSLRIEKGNTTATILSGSYEVGARVIATSGTSIPADTTIVSCSPDCTTANSTVVLSKAPTEPATGTAVKVVKIFATKFSSVTGSFHVGDVLSGTGIASGTVVTAVGAGTLTTTKATTSAYSSGSIALTITEPTAPVPFNATAAELQSAIDAMPAFTPGELTVTGGPGGDIDHPYLISFGGSLANQNVEQLGTDSSGLIGEGASALVSTSLPGGTGTGTLIAFPANNGGKASNGTITATLGPLPAGIVTSGPAFGKEWSCPGSEAGQSTVTCVTTRKIAALGASPNPLDVPVEVQASGPFTASTHVELSGGGASAPATFELPIVVSNEPAPFGLAAIWAGAYEADGSEATQAGGHPYSAASYFMATTVRTPNGVLVVAGDSRDVIADLQPGFVGNPLATKRCPQSTPIEPEGGSALCNEEMSAGILAPLVGSIEEGKDGSSGAGGFEEQRIFNDVPPQGYVAAFTTKLAVPLQTVLASIRSEDDYGVRLFAPNNANFKKIYGAFAAFEGVPKHGTGQALVTNSTDCAEQAREPAVFRLKADTWQEPGHFFSAPDVPVPPVTGCGNLEFDPSFGFQPTSTQGSSPVGAVAHLHIPNEGLTDPSKLAAPELKQAVVTLPQGFDLNPSSANGLEACSEAQIGYRGSGFALPNPLRFTEAQPSCPDGSKLGTVEVKTPLLENPLVGTVYLAAQEENPFGSLLAIYLVVNDPLTGVIVKLPGKIDVGPGGQLTATFDYNPQLPFEDLTINFRGGGPRSELSTPEVCGHYETKGSWTPWSAPESGPAAQTSDGFDVQSSCSPSEAAKPFNPGFEAGTTSPTAGSFSPFTVKLSRKDGEKELTGVRFTLPPGLLGRIAGVPYCSEVDIATAQSKKGKDERAHPSCPPASRLGSVNATAGVGSEPLGVSGDIYLAGPYKGAPLSAVVIVPAVAGPFDLGNVVVRSQLRLDPATAQITAESDPFPTALRNIPVKIRSVGVDIDKPGFTFNPTSCEAMQITGSLSGPGGASASLHNRFQVGGCEGLAFEPDLFTRVYGPTTRGGFPRFRGIVTAKEGEANTSKLVVSLPHSEFLEQGHIRTVCTRVQFAADQCPQGSIYGHIAVTTPLLDYTLEGNAYLRSSSHKLPDLVLALKGPPSQPIEVELDGRIDSTKTGIRTTFESVPDAPFTEAVLTMQGGKKGLLVNSRNICANPGRVSGLSSGQNGKSHEARPVLRNGKCGQAHKRAHRRKRRGHR
jgi:hypothetical protein